MKTPTRRELRSKLANEIYNCTDFDSSLGSIPALIMEIEYELNEPTLDIDKIKEYLNGVKQSCTLTAYKMEQNYHAFKMLQHFVECIGLKYDPMY